MYKTSSKTLIDLEFETVVNQIKEFALTEPGIKSILDITPLLDSESILIELKQTSEYLSSFENENVIPNHYFDSIFEELKVIMIEDYYLELSSFRKVLTIVNATNELLKFFDKFKEYYPTLYLTSINIKPNTSISSSINNVINKFGEIKDDASPDLKIIRKQLKGIQGKINQSFSSALSHFNSLGFLDDIRETVIDNKRVLAVQSMYRKKVKGSLLGNSKTGSISYIEPQATLQLTRELQELELQERNEIIRILRRLTAEIKDHKPLLLDYQLFLTQLDVVYSKAKYAEITNSILPNINFNKTIELREAYHPILLVANKEKKQITYPQSISLNDDNRIIVISGPNAGGKSITLKTIGLLQVMLQSGILIPVHERSNICFFDRRLTDIGDNQSIEHHLSTYSYRLKNMNHFLKKCNENTLFLIDEFGTGSDPELGGALAETFLEVFYDKKAFGIITTHYANLKILADELPEMTNANMMFDNKTLQPTFQLALGQPGSSFTFEVAQKNGIPYSLINKAKKKVERGKVRFDKTIARLQKERSKLEKTSKNLSQEEEKIKLETNKYEKINERIQLKLESYQQLFDSNQKMIAIGERVDKLAEAYFNNKQKKRLIGEFLKLVEVENSKRIKKTKKERVAKKKKALKLKAEVEEKISVIRKEKQLEKNKENQAPKKHVKLSVGDRVRLIGSRSVGTLDKIEKKKAFVNYGIFTSECNIDQLELVQKTKK